MNILNRLRHIWKAATGQWAAPGRPQRDLAKCGHAFDAFRLDAKGREHRYCRACTNKRDRKYSREHPRTLCGNGHAYTEESRYLDAKGRPRRRCLVCAAFRQGYPLLRFTVPPGTSFNNTEDQTITTATPGGPVMMEAPTEPVPLTIGSASPPKPSGAQEPERE